MLNIYIPGCEVVYVFFCIIFYFGGRHKNSIRRHISRNAAQEKIFFHPHMQNIKPLAPRNALRTGRSFPYCHPSAPVSTARVAWVRSFVCGRKIKLKEFYKLSFVVRFAACKYYILDFANRAAMETPQSLGCRLSGWLVPSVHQQSASRSEWTSSLCTKFSLGTIGCTCAKKMTEALTVGWSEWEWNFYLCRKCA